MCVHETSNDKYSIHILFTEQTFIVSLFQNRSLEGSNSKYKLFELLHETWSHEYMGPFFNAIDHVCVNMETLFGESPDPLGNLLDSFLGRMEYKNKGLPPVLK